MPKSTRPTVVLDADDTLWETQKLYDEAKEEFFAIMGDLGFKRTSVASTFSRIDVENVERMGFSPLRFPSSMQLTYAYFQSGAGVSTNPIISAKVAAVGRRVFATTPALRPDARAVLLELREEFRLILFTAGDEQVQQTRVQESGLASLFSSISITGRKTGASWKRLLDEQSFEPLRAWSVGNSARSDISPARSLGLSCILLVTKGWDYEIEHISESNFSERERLWRADTLTAASQIIQARSRGASP